MYNYQVPNGVKFAVPMVYTIFTSEGQLHTTNNHITREILDMFTGYGTKPKKFKVSYKSSSVIAVMSLDNIMSETLQERGKLNKWTQAKIEFMVDNHNGEIIDAMKVKDRECERCMKPVTPRNVRRLPDGTIAHYYECS